MTRRPHVLVLVAAVVAVVCAATSPALRWRPGARAEPRLQAVRGPVATASARASGQPAVPTPAATRTGSDAQAPNRPGKVLYLTFDDGPSPTWTPKVLAVLRQQHARATFFQIGMEVRRFPQTAASVRAAGHAVGNHTSHHADLTKLSAKGLSAELAGGPAARCVRPPFGDVDAHVRTALAARHLRTVLWDVDTEDWEEPGTKHVVHELEHEARPGRVVLLHDGGGDRHETVAALRQALPVLARRGYRFESLPGC